MTTAWVIMTAMPPTKGHANLIRFAAALPVQRVNVVVSTQPHEPYPMKRFLAVTDFARTVRGASVYTYHLATETEQDPSAPGFWEYWEWVFTDGLAVEFEPGDIWVTSEPYGAELARRLGGMFMPYDPQRELLPVKATPIREDPLSHFDEIMPQFQSTIRKTVTLFGAESTGKTTLSKELAATMNGHWLFEWARPYLETVGKEITREKMIAIWHGQAATQLHATGFIDKPFIVQDTDLFSTIGYWEQPHWTEALGPVPEQLITEAKRLQSDLYIMPQSNIPFERDEIRYGIDKRESPDEFWIGIAEKYGLRYKVLEESELWRRVSFSQTWMKDLFDEHELAYDRRGL